uniref:Uncharacterized protein n=1 Tax=Anguilla anguilla TaxID=7936 RepID=A0A0E9TNZ8_ANGAN
MMILSKDGQQGNINSISYFGANKMS